MSTTYEPGSPASFGSIGLCNPEIRGNEWKYIKECLDTNWISSVGSYVSRFEEQLAAYVGVKYGIATVNGTAALHTALLVSGVKPDDEVLVSALTFIAPANTIRYAGAWPVFIDVEPHFWQMDPQHVADFLTKECRWDRGELRNKLTGRRIKAIMPVHILGHPVDIDPILQLARKYDLIVIEDATESLGALYRGKPVGQFGDVACFSFNGNKLITTGGGGMVLTDNAEIASKAKYYTTQAKDDPLEYIHNEIGYNYRLTNIQAALGCAQLEQIDDFIKAKLRISSTYTGAFCDFPGITTMQQAAYARSVFWLYTILIDPHQLGIDSRSLLRIFAQENIQTRPLWQPLHLSKAFLNCQERSCPVAEELNKKALSLPCSVGLKPHEQKKVIDVLLRSYQKSLQP